MESLSEDRTHGVNRESFGILQNYNNIATWQTHIKVVSIDAAVVRAALDKHITGNSMRKIEYRIV